MVGEVPGVPLANAQLHRLLNHGLSFVRVHFPLSRATNTITVRGGTSWLGAVMGCVSGRGLCEVSMANCELPGAPAWIPNATWLPIVFPIYSIVIYSAKPLAVSGLHSMLADMLFRDGNLQGRITLGIRIERSLLVVEAALIAARLPRGPIDAIGVVGGVFQVHVTDAAMPNSPRLVL